MLLFYHFSWLNHACSGSTKLSPASEIVNTEAPPHHGHKLVSQNGEKKHLESVKARIFVLQNLQFITICLNVEKSDIRCFEASVNQLA